MKKNLVKIFLKDKSGEITIVQRKPSTLWEIDLHEAMAWSEASVQLLEGSDYEYQTTQGGTLDIDNTIFHPSLFNKYQGTIRTQNYIGTYSLPVHNSAGELIDTVYIEIKSKKFNYRKELRWMLRDYAEKCLELLLHSNAKVLLSLNPGNTIKAKTLYQRFAFIKSVLLSIEFKRAISKILCEPVTGWKTYTTVKGVGNVKISNRKLLRQIAFNPSRQPLGTDHYFRDKLPSIPAKFTVEYKISTTDTIENQFIKFAPTHFSTFLQDFVNQFKKKDGMLYNDACHLERQIDALLSHTFFKDLSTLKTIPFNNLVLQRKEGYREVFRTWLMFDMAANLAWKGGEEVFRAGRKDVPMLFEYWLFFLLLDAAKAVFIMSKHDIEDLIKISDDQLGIILKREIPFQSTEYIITLLEIYK